MGLYTAHVKRLWAVKTPDGAGVYDGSQPGDDPDSWIDVFRLDSITMAHRRSQEDGTTESFNFFYRWLDGYLRGERLSEDANSQRQSEPIAIYDQSEAISPLPKIGDDAVVPLYVIDKLKMSNRGERLRKGISYLDFGYIYHNDPKKKGATRDLKTIRVPNNDLAGLDLIKGPISWDNYKKALAKGTIDDSQYVDVELIKSYLLYLNFDARGILHQVTKEVYTQSALDLVQLFKNGDPNTPPFRLDPLQIIVNVSFGGGLAVEFFDGVQ